MRATSSSGWDRGSLSVIAVFAAGGAALGLTGQDLVPPWAVVLLGVGLMLAGSVLARRLYEAGVRAPREPGGLTRAQVASFGSMIVGWLVLIAGACWWIAMSLS